MKEEMIAAAKDEDIDIRRFFNALPEQTLLHSEHVAALTRLLLFYARQEGICESEPLPLPLDHIGRAVLYHDVGMAFIPERLLQKTEELTGAERRVVQRHASYGAKLIDKFRTSHPYPPEEESTWRLAAEVAGSHHERWDGKGYPFGLLATASPLVSRAAAITDTYDAIVRGSPFRMALPHEYALFEIADNAGTQFDPDLVDIFNRYETEICITGQVMPN